MCHLNKVELLYVHRAETNYLWWFPTVSQTSDINQNANHCGHNDYRINSLEDRTSVKHYRQIIFWEASFCNHQRNWLNSAKRCVLKTRDFCSQREEFHFAVSVLQTNTLRPLLAWARSWALAVPRTNQKNPRSAHFATPRTQPRPLALRCDPRPVFCDDHSLPLHNNDIRIEMGSDHSCEPQLQQSRASLVVVWLSYLRTPPAHLRRPGRRDHRCSRDCLFDPLVLRADAPLSERITSHDFHQPLRVSDCAVVSGFYIGPFPCTDLLALSDAARKRGLMPALPSGME